MYPFVTNMLGFSLLRFSTSVIITFEYMFRNKVVVITGASRGIGRSIAEEFLMQGAIVLGVSKNTPQQKITSRNYTHILQDLSNAANIDMLASILGEKIDHIDILVHCAGIKKRTTFEDADADAWDITMAINLRTPYLLTQKLVHFLMPGSSIVFIASQAGVGYVTRSIEYGISKSGIIYLTKSLAKLLAVKGVRVNAISPGRTYTDLTNYGMDTKKEKEALANIPLRHINTPEEIAQSVAFLCGPGSVNITGQVISVDGGECIS
ncbi:MAG TPA: SDR family oxidoreductase [Candidatus Saccharibacteria bacterium]|nr:SDR family oxidoreductase [Candidatus Saccharibacteria bacterium]